MLSYWKSFLKDQGATFSDENLVSFRNSDEQNESLIDKASLCDLSDQGIIKVSGEDAQSFLQNQLTNDISHIDTNSHQESAWCSPKGRIIATFRIFKREEAYYLILSADLLEHAIKKLGMYVMMSKVTLEDVSESLAHFGFSGTDSESKLLEFLDSTDLTVPSKSGQTSQYKSLSILRVAGNLARFEIIGEYEDAKQLWEHFQQDATMLRNNYWSYLNISAGLPHISKESSESWIPQMVNYIAVGGVDFKKGCYPGQEIVARLNYLGKTKRRMYRLALDTDQIPSIGESLHSGNDATDAGKILNAALTPSGQIEALAILKIAETEKPLSLASNKDINISILDLPYSLDDS